MRCKIVASVLYDYDARTSEELTVKEGNVVLVIDDNDPDWWKCILRVSDTFEEAQEGLVPVTYVEEVNQCCLLEPKLVANALYDYEARTEDEVSFSEGAAVLVYENDDPEWWFARIDNNVGLIPANYVSAGGEILPTNGYAEVGGGIEDKGTSGDNEDAEAQKAKLLNTLDMFGPGPKIPKGPKTERAPGDVKMFPITVRFAELQFINWGKKEINKKSKKNNRKVLLGVSDDYIIYLCDEFEAVVEKWDFKELSKFSEKKGKKLVLEFGGDAREFEGEKEEVERIMKRLEEIKVRSTVSGPIITGPPPNVGPPPGSLSGNLPFATSSPPVIVPSPAAMNKGPTKVAIALYDYEATTDEELTVQENDDLIVVDDTDDDWWLVRLVKRGGGEGLVPKSYVE
ncbi:cytoskeletal protein binding protein, partial [Dinochytrium kinnereticum]